MKQISKNEVMRYAGCKQNNAETDKLFFECCELVKDKLNPQYCIKELSVSVNNDTCDFALFTVCSRDLAKFLSASGKTFVFAATLGFEFDRLLAKYSAISPAKACMLQAIGVERIEAYADELCQSIECECGKTVKRFSAGYGDLALSVQKDIFNVLDCTKKLGITLNKSFVMSPTKSITAFIGVFDNKKQSKHKCSECDNKNCLFRR